jgi:molybdopterin synthase sulfur carrier subunit
VQVRLFASAREAAGRRVDEFDARTLGEVLELMAGRYGAQFASVLARSRVWVNGDEAAAGSDTELDDGDEVAVLPPVSGGCGVTHSVVVGRTGGDPDR